MLDFRRTPKSRNVETTTPTSTFTRLIYAFVGLLAGDAVLLIFLLYNAVRIRAALVASHMGNPAGEIPLALETFAMYAVFSFVGWLFVGLPIARFFPARILVRLSWPIRLLVGATLGPLALLIIFLLLSHGHLSWPAGFTGTGLLWAYAIVVSTVCFSAYVILLCRG